MPFEWKRTSRIRNPCQRNQSTFALTTEFVAGHECTVLHVITASTIINSASPLSFSLSLSRFMCIHLLVAVNTHCVNMLHFFIVLFTRMVSFSIIDSIHQGLGMFACNRKKERGLHLHSFIERNFGTTISFFYLFVYLFIYLFIGDKKGR